MVYTNKDAFQTDAKTKIEDWTIFQQFRFVFSAEQQRELDDLNLQMLRTLRSQRESKDKSVVSVGNGNDDNNMMPLTDGLAASSTATASSSSSSSVVSALPHLEKASVVKNLGSAIGKPKTKSAGAAASEPISKKQKQPASTGGFSIDEPVVG